jgi:hypothetical protein
VKFKAQQSKESLVKSLRGAAVAILVGIILFIPRHGHLPQASSVLLESVQ